MKICRAVSLVVIFAALTGCGKSQSANPITSTNAVSSAATTNQSQSTGAALEQYGHTMALAKNKAQTQMDLIGVDRAVQAFQADRGKYPETLDELIKEGFLPKLPDLPPGKKYSYDAQTGTVSMVDAN